MQHFTRTVAIVDDHSILRAGLTALLHDERDLDVVDAVADAEAAIRSAREHQPDLMLLDIAMPGRSGTDVIGDIRRHAPGTKLLVLTLHKEDHHVFAAFRAGANGYVLKDDNPDELFRAIRSVLDGKTYLSPSVAHTVISGIASGDGVEAPVPLWEQLTKREREVMKLVAEGHTNKDIARQLSLSPRTVEKHRTNLMRKLGLHSVVAITTYAIQNGLLS
jgi:two-component system response regulator NreC